MAQLTMIFKKGTPLPPLVVPEGYSLSTYRDESDKAAWVVCCRDGLVGDDAKPDVFDTSIGRAADCVPERDCLFLDHGGEHVATITAIYHPDRRLGHLHMVAVRKDFRGRGLGHVIVAAALSRLSADDPDEVFLKTDDWRLPAIKSYLRAGFQPKEVEPDEHGRWTQIFLNLDLGSGGRS